MVTILLVPAVTVCKTSWSVSECVFLHLMPGSVAGSSMLGMTVTAEDRISLEAEAHTKFSVWVSFCEIYNENIHDLLEAVPSGAPRRTALRLSQDVKGNAFVKGRLRIQ